MGRAGAQEVHLALVSELRVDVEVDAELSEDQAVALLEEVESGLSQHLQALTTQIDQPLRLSLGR